MTAVAIVVSRDVVHVFADSAAIGPTGRLVKSASKIMQFKHARMCAVTRGSIAHSWWLRKALAGFANYDETRAGMVDRLQNPLWRIFGPLELYVAGINARGTPSAFMVATHSKHECIPPWTVIDIDCAITTGPAPVVDAERDPIGFGVRAAEMQREVLQRLPFSRKLVSIVGGRLDHAMISPAGITIRTLGGWADRYGGRPNPKARFTASGAGVRRAAPKRGKLRPWRIAAIVTGAWLTLAAIITAPSVPALARLESTFPSASEEKFETSDGWWGVWARPDLGLLVTVPTPGRASWGQWTLRPATVDQHEAAAMDWLVRNGRGCCRLTGSVEVARATYEHRFECAS